MKNQRCEPVRETYKTDRGMSLIELTVIIGVLSVVSFGLAAILNANITSHFKAEGKKSFISDIYLMQTAIKGAITGQSCTDVLQIAPGSQFSTTNPTPVVINLAPRVYRDGVTLADPTGGQFRIDKIYLSDAIEIARTTSEIVYATNLNIEASVKEGASWLGMAKRSVASVSVKMNSSNTLVDCNMPAIEDQETICKSVNGMKWSPTAQACIQDIELQPNSNFNCPEGMTPTQSGVCVYAQSGCYLNLLPTDFDDGIVYACNSLPANTAVNYPSGYRPPNYTPPSAGGTQVSPSPTPNASATCACGQWQIPPSTPGVTNEFCAQTRKIGNKCGGPIDTQGDIEMTVKQCVNGNLQILHTYCEEESSTYWYGYKPATCNLSGSNCRKKQGIP